MIKLVLFTFLVVSKSVNGGIAFGDCLNPSLQENFDIGNYAGVWYEQRRDTAALFELGECSQAKYTPR
jgi:lipocalin